MYIFIFFIDSRFLHEAIKKGGFVEVTISKVLVQGPALVGKTSVKCLILSQVYDKDKPYSTGLAELTQTAFQQFGKNKGKWELVSDENIIQMFAEEIKYIIENDKSENVSRQQVDVKDSMDIDHGNPNESSSEDIKHHQETELMPSSLNKKDDMSRKTQDKHFEQSKLDSPATTSTDMPAITSMDVPAITSIPEVLETNTQEDLAEQLTDLLNKASGRTDKLQMYKEWLYFIDSGGQIQFQQILQAFIPYVSVLMLVISLKERLSSQSCTKFRDEDGTIIVSKHSISIKTLLRRLISMVSFNNQQKSSDPIKLPKMLRVIAVATYEDEQGEETIEEKEAQLTEIFQSAKFYLHYKNASSRKILFKVDGRKALQENVEGKAITKIRNELRNRAFKVKIPLRWYAFEIFLRSKAAARNTSDDTSDSCCGILKLEECRSIGIKLGLKSDEIENALKYFHLLNTILYYPSKVTDLVFIDPYSLIQVVNELVILVWKVRKEDDNHKDKDDDDDNDKDGSYDLQQMANFGIISSEALSNDRLKMFKKISSKFSGFESHLFKIFTHLSLASKLPHKIPHDSIFMPALLPLTDPLKGIPCKFKNDKPFLFYFENGTPVGFFCAMIINLLSNESKKDDCNSFQWKLHETSTKMFYSNFVVLQDDKSKCTLALLESFDWFEIHCKDCKDSLKVKKAIESAIMDTARKQKQRLHLPMIEKEVKFEIAFYSPCGKKTKDGHFHIATIVEDDSRLFCKQCNEFVENSKVCPHLSWITCIPGM